eukprot:6404408-Prymnesium_polylepis.1
MLAPWTPWPRTDVPPADASLAQGTSEVLSLPESVASAVRSAFATWDSGVPVPSEAPVDPDAYPVGR